MIWSDLPCFGEPLATISVKLTEEINQGKNILPPVGSIMTAMDLVAFEDVRVVILGQDPYPTAGHANGLAFSVNPNVQPLPKSLKNIYKELEEDLAVVRTNGDLSDWARQGVLLLNTALTVEEGKAGSHKDIGWNAFTTDVITNLNQYHDHIIFLLWGKHAQSYTKIIDGGKHLILTSPHPSPLSAYRGFFGSKPFSKINAHLSSCNMPTIRW